MTHSDTTNDLEPTDDAGPTGAEIAIVGMAAHLPGAPDARTYWRNLAAGVESIRRLERDELLRAGVPEELLDDPDFVPVAATLDGFDEFDADFFGLSPKEAAIMDPQHRHFLEAVWEALEDAGHPPERFDGPVGVFAGCGMGAYFANNLLRNRRTVEEVGLFLLRHTGNDKDFLATRASYLFDLKGPSVNVQTACSTSLVAVHQAAQSLLSHECDMALAGGVTIELPHGHGYLYKAGEILSPDGHVHAFDERAQGTVFGSGVGILVLRRLEDALADGDHVYAVIRGSAINNDGSGKAGYLAPSVDGQAAAIAEALAVADVTGDEIDYVECHGTGTAIGDPIEIAALTQAFRETTDATGTCAIGSVKTNIGHLDTAAGVASLIKVAQALENRLMPPSLGYERANASIDFASTPFFVNDRARAWEPGARPRRAGVTSLGVGGTNAHVVLEEAPALAPGTPSARRFQPFLLSAKSAAALDGFGERLADRLATDAELDLGDVAYTLGVGRRAFDQRRVLVARDAAEASELLRSGDRSRVFTHRCGERPADVCFLFAGGGAQHVEMARGLYETDATFRRHMARGFEWLASRGVDLCSTLYPAADADRARLARELERPSLQLPALFLVEYALAQVWLERGVTPSALLGHSMGENTAACVAGVMGFEDALGLVLLRGQLFERVPAGGMLSVAASEASVREVLPTDLDLACVNARDLCVVSGPAAALDAFAATLEERELDFQRIAIDIAAHSRLLEPILAEFGAYLRGIALAPPTIPIVSNVTGRELTDSEATDPEYWVRHLRSTVRFADGVEVLAEREHRVLLEVGPGRVLSSLARAGLSDARHQHAFHSLRHPDEDVDDTAAFETAHARLWATGAIADAAAFWEGESRRRVSLPTYAFQRRRYWIDADPVVAPSAAIGRIDDPERHFARRVWQRAPLGTCARDWSGEQVLVLRDAAGVGERVAADLRERGAVVTEVVPGDAYARLDTFRFALAPEHGREGYDLLLRDLVAAGRAPSTIVHLWSLTQDDSHRPGSSRFHETIERGFYALFFLGQSLIGEQLTEGVELLVVANGVVSVAGEGVAEPAKALALGAVRTLPREAAGLSARLLDVELDRRPTGFMARTAGFDAQVAAAVTATLAELDARAPLADGCVARRQDERFTSLIAPATPGRGEAFTPIDGGAYLVTGGMGGIGLTLARRLAKASSVRLALLGRSTLPPRAEWDAWIAAQGDEDGTSRRIRAVRELESAGATVLPLAADVTDPQALATALEQVRDAFGRLDGVFHAAGVVDDGLLANRALHAVEEVLAPKVHGTVALDAALRAVFGDEQPRTAVYFSSTSAAIGAAGQIDYAAANAFLDAWADRRGNDGTARREFETALAWGIWRDVGMAARAAAGGEESGVRKGLARHPLFESRTEYEDGRRVLNGRWNTRDLWVLDDHRTAEGDALLPGTGSFELFGAALRELGEVGAFTVRDLTFFRALCVPDDAEVLVRVVLEPDAAGYRAEVHSRRSAADDWQRHTTATLGLRRVETPAAVDVMALIGSSERRAAANGDSGSSTLVSPQEAHLAFGPRWRVLREVRRGADFELARLALPEDVRTDLAEWPLHPGLLDLATGFAMDLVPGYDASEGLWVPVRYERVVVHAPLAAEIWAVARPAAGAGSFDGEFAFDVDILDAGGALLMEVRGFAIHRLAQTFRPKDLPAPRPEELVRDESALRRRRSEASDELARRVRLGLTEDEGMDALWRVLGEGSAHHTFVSTLDVPALVAEAGAAASEEREDGGARFERPDLDSDYVEPRDDVERALVELFQELLGVERVGVEDSFFDLGGHSLVAVRLFARIKKAFGVDQPMSVLFEAPTPAAQAELIRAAAPETGTASRAAEADRESRRFVHLVPMHSRAAAAGTSRTPFFLVAGMFGNVLNLRHVASLVGSDRPFYGLQARGLFDDLEPHETFEEAARDYIAELRTVQPNGPYLLGGFSGGGLTAYEMAHQLRAAGEEVSAVVLLDTPLAYRDPIDALDKLHIHAQRIARRGPGYLFAWAKDRLAWQLEQRRKAAGPGGPDAAEGGQFHDEAIEAAFRRALERYETRDYEGSVHLFRPALPVVYQLRGGRRANQWREVVHDDNGWSRHVARLEVREVPGDHDSMVLEPNVRALAAHLRRVLDEAEREAQLRGGAPFLRRTG
ncbi:Phthiocerol synthesis polyketide synthase type I PpsE [Planctomycetes bacterium Pla163]|uniref:Phthiocerol synthesis polyketide synthase type I PpsE n=1 Tax=Rohdeia mirabilis TaxID=2528008 RepID=A0A518D3M4_9BACT|nr:Phthiocerol synthesis polyketide synthase type I PpsE [Planctomycetes bacterium Pla163]